METELEEGGLEDGGGVEGMGRGVFWKGGEEESKWNRVEETKEGAEEGFWKRWKNLTGRRLKSRRKGQETSGRGRKSLTGRGCKSRRNGHWRILEGGGRTLPEESGRAKEKEREGPGRGRKSELEEGGRGGVRGRERFLEREGRI